jgi:hypothetical protein
VPEMSTTRLVKKSASAARQLTSQELRA